MNAKSTIPISASSDSSSATLSGLQSLDITDYRNIGSARLAFCGGLNLITGVNAAGKTSLLEAIHCLGRARSFRSTNADRQIREGQSAFRLVGRVVMEAGRSLPIGIERRDGNYTIHAAGEPIRRLSNLAGNFPVHIMTGDTATVLNGGPRYRRQSLDWALFHVEHGYRQTWQRYARSLRQRNAALRERVPAKQVSVWDHELVEVGGLLDRIRRHYLAELAPVIAEEVNSLLADKTFSLRYQSGWARDLSMQEALAKSLESDQSQGYTHVGPHRADFSLFLDDKPAMTHFSRGQQKALSVAFLLAQVKLQHVRGKPGGAFLLDDIASELDAEHQARVLAALAELGTQVFVTAIDAGSLDIGAWAEQKRFHVEHGVIAEPVQRTKTNPA
ncbi:MAG: DNA replication/repair protein RecF [Pseudomonadota bacterium]